MRFLRKRQTQHADSQYELREAASALAGLGCILASIYWYRQTVIDAGTFLLLPALLTGFLAARRWPKKESEFYGSGPITRRLLGFTVHTVLWGGLFSALILGLNRTWLRNGTRQQQPYPIVAKSSMTGERGQREKRRPVATVEIAGQSKALVFDYEQTMAIDSLRTLRVTTQTGLLGFVVILETEIATE